MLIVSALTNYAFAQKSYEGHGYASIDAQRGNGDVETVLFGRFEEACKTLRYEVELAHGVKVRVDQSTIRKTIREDLADALGEPFYQDRRDEYTLTPHTYDTRSREWIDYCSTHKDSYFTVDLSGNITPYHNGNIMTAFASENKPYRTVVTVTHIPTKRSADIFNDCYNVTFLVAEHYGPAPSPAPVPQKDTVYVPVQPPPAPVVQTKPCHISDFAAFPVKLITRNAVRKNGLYTIELTWKSDSRMRLTVTDSTADRVEGVIPGYYDRLDVHPTVPVNPRAKKWDEVYVLTGCNARLSTVVTIDTRTWFGRNKAVWIPVAVAIVAGVADYCIHSKHESNLDNSWVHDSNGSPWPAGSGGNTPNGPTFGAARRTFGLGYAIHFGH